MNTATQIEARNVGLGNRGAEEELSGDATGFSRASVLAARIAGTLFAGLLVLDSTGKLLQLAPVIEESARLGYSADLVPVLGIIELACAAAYLVPATSPFGAILLTGFFGGAIATHVRLGDPLATHTLFPIFIAAILWGALYVRDARVRGLVRR